MSASECVNKNETETKKKLVWNRLAVKSSHQWIDPNGSGYNGWGGRMMDKALRMSEISRLNHGLSGSPGFAVIR